MENISLFNASVKNEEKMLVALVLARLPLRTKATKKANWKTEVVFTTFLFLHKSQNGHNKLECYVSLD
jgi:hypothetical protein